MSVRILIGDVRDKLRELPADSVDCVVTSPPYYGLRDYGMEGQIGLEPSPDEYVAALVGVFREVRRVLRHDGTVWLNIGDSYGSGTVGRNDTPRLNAGMAGGHGGGSDDGNTPRMGSRPRPLGIKPKDMIGIPWMVAFALRADGWWLRQDIIWSKPNPMPESITDRCTKAHEYIFLLAKSQQYHYDAKAISEPASASTLDRASKGYLHGGSNAPGRGDAGDVTRPFSADPRNRRSVWTVATAPYSEAHFATFPPALIEPCIKAGCRDGGTVLDPFGGAGTTGLVADRLQRDAILIELNPQYAEIARKRIESDAGMLFGAPVTTCFAVRTSEAAE